WIKTAIGPHEKSECCKPCPDPHDAAALGSFDFERFCRERAIGKSRAIGVEAFKRLRGVRAGQDVRPRLRIEARQGCACFLLQRVIRVARKECADSARTLCERLAPFLPGLLSRICGHGLRKRLLRRRERWLASLAAFWPVGERAK